MKYLAIAVLVCSAFLCGWFGAQRYRKLVLIPTGTARLEVPRGCQPRLWMNGIEVDCKNGAIMYYASKLERKSP